MERYKDILCRDYDAPTLPPVADKDQIHFNGKEDDGHETFVFTPRVPKFAFCKTAEKPYDIAVCECLLVLKAYMPNLDISSDGFSGLLNEKTEHSPELDHGWMEAIENVRHHFDLDYKVEITRRRPPYCDMEPVFQGFGSVAAHIEPPIGEESLCQNCGWQGPDGSLKTPIPNIFERVDPGEEMPSGECPDCGALCHIVSRVPTEAGRLRTLLKSCEGMISYVLEDGYHYEGGAEILSQLRTELKKEVACGKL